MKIGFDDTLSLPPSRQTMTGVMAELCDGLYCARPSTVVMEVPKNMRQSYIDVVCGANAKRIIIDVTEHEISDDVGVIVASTKPTMAEVVAELRDGLVQAAASEGKIVLVVPGNMLIGTIHSLSCPYPTANFFFLTSHNVDGTGAQ